MVLAEAADREVKRGRAKIKIKIKTGVIGLLSAA